MMIPIGCLGKEDKHMATDKHEQLFLWRGREIERSKVFFNESEALLGTAVFLGISTGPALVWVCPQLPSPSSSSEQLFYPGTNG